MGECTIDVNRCIEVFKVMIFLNVGLHKIAMKIAKKDDKDEVLKGGKEGGITAERKGGLEGGRKGTHDSDLKVILSLSSLIKPLVVYITSDLES